LKQIRLTALSTIFAIGLANAEIPKIKSAEGDSIASSQQYIDSIIALGEAFIGKPYRFQGPSSWPMDCSGYLAYIFAQYGCDLPRSSTAMASTVTKVDIADLRRGDLMFFTGRNKEDSTVGHVSMAIEVQDGTVRMLHSCRRGITIDEYPQIEYYNQRFLMAGRVPVFEGHPFGSDQRTEIRRSLSEPIVDTKHKISIIGVGDMMLGTNFPSNKYLPPNDGKDLLAPVTEIVSSADVAFGNLEGVLLTGAGHVKKCSDPEVCYAFKMPNHYVKYFKNAGFDVLSLSNNHVGDFGAAGRTNTVKLLQDEGINFAGLLQYPHTTFEKGGIRFGFCAFSPNNGTVSINDTTRAKEIVQHLDTICDIVIVSFHGGGEGSGHRHITRKTEMFLGENRGNPYQFARIVIDAGADIVFGHGPHVTRAIDLYNNRFIAYSLGNFATYARFSLRGVSGLAPIIKVFVDKEGEFQSAQIYSTKQVGEGGPFLDPEDGALKEIISLTATDIPEAPISIGKDGVVRKK